MPEYFGIFFVEHGVTVLINPHRIVGDPAQRSADDLFT